MKDGISRHIYYIRPTDHPKIFYSWGSIFNIEGYGFDGIAILRTHRGMIFDASVNQLENEMPVSCKAFIHCFGKNPIKINEVDKLVNDTLNELVIKGCKRIGFHGVETTRNSYLSVKLTIKSVLKWMELNGDKIDSITFVDAHRGYDYHFDPRLKASWQLRLRNDGQLHLCQTLMIHNEGRSYILPLSRCMKIALRRKSEMPF